MIEILAVIAIIGIIAGLLVPTLYRTHHSEYKMWCQSNLRQIYSFALGFSDKQGNGAYPIAPMKNPRAHESLNLLVECEQHIPPELFLCPEGEATAAAVDPDLEKYTLGTNNLAFSWVSNRMEARATGKALSSDKYINRYRDEQGKCHQGHEGGMNVLMSDHSVIFMKEADLPKETKLPAGLTR